MPDGTLIVVAPMKANGIDGLAANDARLAFAVGSSITVPDAVDMAGMTGSVPNFTALASFGSVTPAGARYSDSGGTSTLSVLLGTA